MSEQDRWDEINSLTQEQARVCKWKPFELTPEQQEALRFIAYPPLTIHTHSIDGVPISKEVFDKHKKEQSE